MRWNVDDDIAGVQYACANLTQPNLTLPNPTSLQVRISHVENEWAEMNEIWYEYYAVGEYLTRIVVNSRSSIIPTKRLLELVRWNVDDATTHDRVRML